jgi:hypothetical protein
MSSDLETCRDDLWTQSEKDNTSVVNLRPVLASPMLSYAEQGQFNHDRINYELKNSRRDGPNLLQRGFQFQIIKWNLCSEVSIPVSWNNLAKMIAALDGLLQEAINVKEFVGR